MTTGFFTHKFAVDAKVLYMANAPRATDASALIEHLDGGGNKS